MHMHCLAPRKSVEQRLHALLDVYLRLRATKPSQAMPIVASAPHAMSLQALQP